MENKKDLATNISMFLTFFTLAWIIYLFPELVNNWHSTTIAIWLLAFSTSSLSLLGTEVTKDSFGDFGVGLSLVILFIGFANSFNNILYKIFMLIVMMFGLFGTYKGIFGGIINIISRKKSNEIDKENKEKVNTMTLNFVLYVVEFFAGIATILEFTNNF